MAEFSKIELIPTQVNDLDFVLKIENLSSNTSYIKQWQRDQHIDSISRSDHEHWIIKSKCDGKKLGYIISYNLTEHRCGVYIKRIALDTKGQGVGRSAIQLFLKNTFHNISTPYIWLCVYPENIRGQKCYKACGLSIFDIPLDERERHSQVAESSPSENLMLMAIYQ